MSLEQESVGHIPTNEDALNLLIKTMKAETNNISDGYHTFGELYEHRIALFILACSYIRMAWNNFGNQSLIWRSKCHSDGELAYGGEWFILGLCKEKGKQITYHIPISKWDETTFAETLDKAPEFDGHTSQDVLSRIKELQ